MGLWREIPGVIKLLHHVHYQGHVLGRTGIRTDFLYLKLCVLSFSVRDHLGIKHAETLVCSWRERPAFARRASQGWWLPASSSNTRGLITALPEDNVNKNILFGLCHFVSSCYRSGRNSSFSECSQFLPVLVTREELSPECHIRRFTEESADMKPEGFRFPLCRSVSLLWRLVTES